MKEVRFSANGEINESTKADTGYNNVSAWRMSGVFYASLMGKKGAIMGCLTRRK